MKILFVSNYEPWVLIANGQMPSNHLFGIKEVLTELSECKPGRWRGSFNRGTVDFVKISNCPVKSLVKYYLLASKYDVVYDVINVVSKVLGLVPPFLRPFKLVTILHHPPFDMQLKYSDSDAYIFFSQELLGWAKKGNEKKGKKMFLNEWKPDFNYYHVEEKEGLIYDFMDCGRTNRDHKTVVDAAIQTGSRCFFFNKKEIRGQKEYEIKEGVNTFFYKENFIPDDVYVSLMKRAKVLVLALPRSNRILGPLGATVLMDALGLQKPIICSDNAYCGNLVEKSGIGLVYKAGSVSSLSECMERMKNNSFYDSCVENIKYYNRRGGMESYSVRAMKIIKNTIDK